MTTSPVIEIQTHTIDSVEARRAAGLPAGWTGVAWHWPGGDIIECRDCIEALPYSHDAEARALIIGTLLVGAVDCGNDHDAIEAWFRARRLTRTIVDGRPVIDVNGQLIEDTHPPDPVGAVEIAARLGVARATVDQWRQRHPDFPACSYIVGGRPAWEWHLVVAWARRTGRL